MKIVINRCYGGFGLSKKAIDRLAELGNTEAINIKSEVENFDKDDEMNKFRFLNDHFHLYETPREDHLLVNVVEELGSSIASGHLAELEVVEIPVGVNWEITEYDGMERIEEIHRSWY